MAALTPEFLFNLESRMRVISATEYERLNAETHWREIAKELPSTGAKERLIWLLDTATIDYASPGGDSAYATRNGGLITFDDLVSNTTEFESVAATAGLKLSRYSMTDLDGGGIQQAASWSRQISAYAAYWPEKQVFKALNYGDQAGYTTYDGKKFFDTAHPVNPFDSAAGTFDNVFTAGAGAGAVPIDTTNAATVDVAFNNLIKAITYVRKLKMPNGVDPRRLRVSKLLVPPALMGRAQQITSAKYIAQAAASGGGAADVEGVISAMGLGTPVVIDEIGAQMTNGSDTSYYLVCEQLAGDSLGGLVYVNRDPFEIVYNSGMTADQLQRANELQWTIRGRNIVGYGHPFLIFKCKAT